MKLDARIVAANMYERNALTLKELQSVQSLRDRPVEAAEMLLNIILEQPDAVYLCFLDVLKHSREQQHIYQTLVEGGYKGEYSVIVSFMPPKLYAVQAMFQDVPLSRCSLGFRMVDESFKQYSNESFLRRM